MQGKVLKGKVLKGKVLKGKVLKGRIGKKGNVTCGTGWENGRLPAGTAAGNGMGFGSL